MMTNKQDPGTRFRTVGLSYMSEGVLRLYIEGRFVPPGIFYTASLLDHLNPPLPPPTPT